MNPLGPSSISPDRGSNMSPDTLFSTTTPSTWYVFMFMIWMWPAAEILSCVNARAQRLTDFRQSLAQRCELNRGKSQKFVVPPLPRKETSMLEAAITQFSGKRSKRRHGTKLRQKLAAAGASNSAESRNCTSKKERFLFLLPYKISSF